MPSVQPGAISAIETIKFGRYGTRKILLIFTPITHTLHCELEHTAHRPGHRDLEILIVDDDKVVCLIQEHNLERIPVQCPIFTFGTGQEALEYLEQQRHKNKAFLILLDIHMPIMNGWEFLQRCQERFESQMIFIAMVTSSMGSAEKKMALDYPMVIAFLEKPLNFAKAQDLMNLPQVMQFLP